jgi:phosphoglycolate phosphatase-like HAD superfamily hydrolase
MQPKIVLVDFAGTLIKAAVIEEANVFRAKVLKRALPTTQEHAHPKELYKVNNEFVEKLTGLTTAMTVKYRKNDLTNMDLTGEQVQHQISTNLFQIGMFMAAKKHGKDIIPKGLVEELQRIQSLGYELAIVSGVRTDIISGMLAIAKIPITFEYIYGQPPILGVSNEKNIADITKIGEITYVMGDKLSDLEHIKSAKKIFVMWGHASGGEEKIADFTIASPEKLQEIIK